MLCRFPLSTIALFALCNAACALDADDAHWCRNGLFPSDKQTIVFAHIAKTTNLYHDPGEMKGCPAERATCRNDAAVTAGQTVLAGKAFGSFVCGYFPASGSAGWVPRGAVTTPSLQPSRDPALRDWTGEWRDGGNSIMIAVSRGGLHAAGSAVWHGFGDNVHEGSFEADAKPSNNSVAFAEEDCRLQARLVGPYLVVSDNAQCGGMNVRFDGVYRRATGKKK